MLPHIISPTEFDTYVSQGYNRIPLVTEVKADLDTPLSIYLKLVGAERKNSFLLESVVGGERFGRYSYIGLPASTYIQSDGFADKSATILYENEVEIMNIKGNPLEAVKHIQAQFKAVTLPNMPRFCGGWVGYFSYEIINYIEECLNLPKLNPQDNLHLPNIKLLLADTLAVVDNLHSKVYLIVYANSQKPNAYNLALNKLKNLLYNLQHNLANNGIKQGITNSIQAKNNTQDNDAAIIYTSTQQQYIENVQKAKEYILAGDIMQVVLSQRMQKKFNQDAISLYRSLRTLNPSPYMYYYCFGDTQIVGSSPELLVRRDINNNVHNVTLRPIAGTRVRGNNEQEDLHLAKELLSDDKECAEHTMLIDLARNDIGKIAKVGSVKVTEHMKIEKYSHVQHIVSSVSGEIDENVHNIDILKAVFPAGTLSGAAKVRAMQIINELEPMPRHIYGGGVGCISFNGEMDIAIAIRTAVIQNETAYIQAGAGIVADSVPQTEWQETQNKAKAMLKAIEITKGDSEIKGYNKG